MQTHNKYRLPAILTGVFLAVIFILSLLYILIPSEKGSGYVADIYQDGELLTSISLSEIQESYTFTVTGENGCVNEIEVCPGKIRILSADCPDKLCVHLGYIKDSLLPITCLPNRLVIQLHPLEESGGFDSIAPDIITY